VPAAATDAPEPRPRRFDAPPSIGADTGPDPASAPAEGPGGDAQPPAPVDAAHEDGNAAPTAPPAPAEPPHPHQPGLTGLAPATDTDSDDGRRR
jgi:hypothetical protein